MQGRSAPRPDQAFPHQMFHLQRYQTHTTQLSANTVPSWYGNALRNPRVICLEVEIALDFRGKASPCKNGDPQDCECLSRSLTWVRRLTLWEEWKMQFCIKSFLKFEMRVPYCHANYFLMSIWYRKTRKSEILGSHIFNFYMCVCVHVCGGDIARCKIKQNNWESSKQSLPSKKLPIGYQFSIPFLPLKLFLRSELQKDRNFLLADSFPRWLQRPMLG